MTGLKNFRFWHTADIRSGSEYSLHSPLTTSIFIQVEILTTDRGLQGLQSLMHP